MMEVESASKRRKVDEAGGVVPTLTGGAYIPPHRLRQLQANLADDKSSEAYQRLTWEALKKSLNGLINKVNVANIKQLVPELFGENLVRGRGLLCKSLIKAQAASLPFTPIYAALVAVLNSKVPSIGGLLLARLVVQFRRAFRRNDKTTCLATSKFIAHLSNQMLVDEFLALQVLALLLGRPTDDSVEIAVGFMREVGAHLTNVAPKPLHKIFERFRTILHEGDIDKRVQYMIEVLFQVRKDKFKDNPPIIDELDLVEEDDQIVHDIDLDDMDIDPEERLNLFQFDPDFAENEQKYAAIKAEILGEDEDDSGSDGSDSGSESGSEEESDDEQEQAMDIQDETGADLVDLRRKIYLTVMSSVNYEECCHKLMKLNIPEGQEIELCNMIIECCSQERTYLKFYGLMGERFCKMSYLWRDKFAEAFTATFETIHRYETNRLRNIAKLFGHLFFSDALPWSVFELIRLNEDDTTSASRIFIKILFQEISEYMGLKKLKERFNDPTMADSFAGMFPRQNPKDCRFAINYWTSIGLGALTDELREWLRTAPQQMMRATDDTDSSDDSSSSGSDSSSSGSESDSDSDSGSDSGSSSSGYDSEDSRRSPAPRKTREKTRSVSRSRSPPSPPRRRRDDSRSPSRSRSPPRGRRVDSRSRTPPRGRRSPSRSLSRSPPRRTRDASRSRSRTPPRRSRRSPSRSVSRSPPRRARQDSRSVSRSPPRRVRQPSRSVSRSPPRRARQESRSPPRRRRYSPSRSRSRTPPRRRRYDSRSPSPRRR
ncbi:armadillo-type protein [Gongronella butleri]|nr:armadillo-type protein [Gongronella butleri]